MLTTFRIPSRPLLPQELEDARVALLEEEKTYINNKTAVINPNEPQKPRIEPEDVLPGYMIKLTGGYEYRTCECHSCSNTRPMPCLSQLASSACMYVYVQVCTCALLEPTRLSSACMYVYV